MSTALDKSDRKKFDDMWELPKFYIAACSNFVQYVILHLILMSILLYHYKQLTACISEVERIEDRVNSIKKKKVVDDKAVWKDHQEKKEVSNLTLDMYFVQNNAISNDST